MRATTLLSKSLQLKHTRITDVRFDDEGLVLSVAPTTQIPRCSGCMCKVRQVYDRKRGRRWRHLDLGPMKLHLEYDLRRVDCPRCGVVVELVPWTEPGSWFTREFEQTVAYMLQQQNTTAVAKAMRISWSTVGSISSRVVNRLRDGADLNGLTMIGIDELSYRRHHSYITCVVDHDRKQVVWAAEGKNAATLAQFFAELGPERAAKLKFVTIDMSAAYIKAVESGAPNAEIAFDRFHVQRLAHDALDEVRRSEVRKTEDPDDRRSLKGTRHALQKNPWNLSAIDSQKVSEVQRSNQSLYRAYLLKESLAALLDRRQVNVVRLKLSEWLNWASRSGLEPFVRVGRTIRKHKEGVLCYVSTRLNNGRVEGLNGKTRTLTRRAYGLHSASSLIALIYLCCSGIKLMPVQKQPQPLPHNV